MMLSDSQRPEMSVILITSNTFEVIARTVAYLRRQTVSDQLEVVIAAPSERGLGIPPNALDGFFGSRVVETDTAASTARARASAIRLAAGPVVAFVEEHSYPNPCWAEALIEAHRGPWAAVAPVMVNANPSSVISWANLLLEYGTWVCASEGGPAEHLPGHNCSYKKSVLLEYGDQLGSRLEAESVLHWDLRKKGHQLCLEPRARIAHLNISIPSAWAPLRFNAGRGFAAARAANGGWSPIRRVLFAAGSPLIPFVRFRRILAQIRRLDGELPNGWRLSLAVFMALLLDGAGEAAGYMAGEGRSPRVSAEMEFYRERYVAKNELGALDDIWRSSPDAGDTVPGHNLPS